MRAVVLISLLYMLRCSGSSPIAVQNDPDSCLVVTPEKQKQISEIAVQVGEFITSLADKYDDIDIINTRLTVEKHSDDEKEKNATISVIINDCAKINAQTDLPATVKDAPSAGDGNKDNTVKEKTGEETAGSTDDTVDDNADSDLDECTEERNGEEEYGDDSEEPDLTGLEVGVVHFNDKEIRVLDEVQRDRKNRPFLLFQRSFRDRGVQNFIFF